MMPFPPAGRPFELACELRHLFVAQRGDPRLDVGRAHAMRLELARARRAIEQGRDPVAFARCEKRHLSERGRLANARQPQPASKP